jgi:hypothetical protein
MDKDLEGVTPPALTCDPVICLERLRKTIETPVRVLSNPVETLTG